MTEKIKKEEGTSLDDEYRQLEKVHLQFINKCTCTCTCTIYCVCTVHVFYTNSFAKIRLQNNCQNVCTRYELC